MRRVFVPAVGLLLMLGACSALKPVDQSPSMSQDPDVRGAPAFVRDGPTGPTDRGHVVRVVDGDTIRVLIGDSEERVRYIGIDTPESVDPRKTIQPYALEASAENKRFVDGRDVVLEKDVSDRDRYGRLLRYVWIQDGDGWRLVNWNLVVEGYASAVSYPPDVKYQDAFRDAERAARDAGVGLWSSD
jgi:micrococcal nuclease